MDDCVATTHILKPKTVTDAFFTRFFRRRSAGAFSLPTLPHPSQSSVDSRWAWTLLGKIELLKQLGLEPGHYKPLLDTQCKWKNTGTYEDAEQHSSQPEKERNRLEVKSLDQKLKNTQKDLDDTSAAKIR
jgi:hypothetical protein